MIQPNYCYKAQIINVVDGDTVDAVIDLGFRMTTTQRLRLARINAPEKFAKDADLRELAHDATDFVITELLDKYVIISTTKADSFGRYLAEIYYLNDNKEKNISDELIANELAVYYNK